MKFPYETKIYFLNVFIIDPKWPLGGQNADFILLKLNNRLVDHQVSWNSTFLLVFWKVNGILSLEQSTVLGAEGCALIAAVPKTACNFQHQEYVALLRENFCTRGNFIREIDCDYQKELKISTRCRKWIFAEKCKQFWEPLQSASTCKHLKQMTVSASESHELSKKPIKKLNFDWYSGEPVGYLIWKSSSLHLCHQLVKMIRTG